MVVVFPVPAQTARVAIALVAAISSAFERLFVPMSEKMAIKMVLSFECLVAHSAQILAFVTVGKPVFGQRRRIAKHLIAQIALLRTSFTRLVHDPMVVVVGGWGRE